jgi:hypothetical protein
MDAVSEALIAAQNEAAAIFADVVTSFDIAAIFPIDGDDRFAGVD